MKASLRFNFLVSWLAAITLCVELTLLLRPYDGIRHDSVLYFGQALHLIFPQELNQDLFFAYGSQGDFTLLPRLLVVLITWFGVEKTSMLGVLLGLAFFTTSTAYFASKKLPHYLVLWSILCVIVWPSSYGGFGVFRFQEPYFTGRSIAEPLTILAMAIMLTRGRWLSLLLLIIAFGFHPLQTIPGLLVWWGWQVLENRRWLILGFFMTGLIVFVALLGVSPFSQLFVQYDSEWMEAIENPSRHVRISEWPLQYWIWLALDFFIIFAARKFLPGDMKRWTQVIVWVTAICFLGSFLLVDLSKSVLFTGLQIWRSHWLLHWAALICIPSVIFGLYRLGDGARLTIFSTTIFSAAPYGQFAAVYMAAITIPLYIFWPICKVYISRPYVVGLYVGLGLAISVTYLRYVSYLLGLMRDEDVDINWGKIDLALSHPVILTFILILAIFIWKKKSIITKGILLIGVGTLLLVASNRWDKRLPLAKMIESNQDPTQVFNYKIEQGSVVFWQAQLLAPWMMLHRASYWSDLQQAGLLFNRETAIESYRRSLLVEPLLFQIEICEVIDRLNKKRGECQISWSAVKDPCNDEKFHPGYLVLASRLPIKSMGTFVYLAEAGGEVPGKLDLVTMYLYSCKDISLA